MDDIVRAAIARWPNVPAVFGWLSLSRRGEWRIKGEPIGNDAIRAFIGRNYANDGCGNWFFQNGPQRVYVSLDMAPFIYRLDEFGRIVAHNDAQPRELRQVFADDDGRLYFETELGPGALDDRDLSSIGARIVDGRGESLDDAQLESWSLGATEAHFATAGLHIQAESFCPIERIDAGRVPDVLGFRREPQSPRKPSGA